MARVYLGLGSNLGDREGNLTEALRLIGREVEIEAVSSVYESEPVGFRDQPEFLNLAVRARTDLPPDALLRALLRIEERMGRARSFRNAPRTIDIDILLYDDARLSTPDLELPHPRLLERAFVLRPLVELDATLRHPTTGERLADRLGDPGLERAEPRFPGSRLLENEAGGSAAAGEESAAENA